MTEEFAKRLELLNLDKETFENVRKIIEEAGKEFPCLSCPSKDNCANFKWFIKWFGAQE
jgi:hypothetical protein